MVPGLRPERLCGRPGYGDFSVPDDPFGWFGTVFGSYEPTAS
jgi:hypothetical protein